MIDNSDWFSAHFLRFQSFYGVLICKFEPKYLKKYSRSVKQLYGKGYVLTGNSAEFLDPAFSSGVTFATESMLLVTKLITRNLNIIGKRVDINFLSAANYLKKIPDFNI